MRKFLQSRKRIICIVAPALIGALFLILCFLNIRQSVWFDESYSSYITRFDFGTMLKFTSADVHPPLYYVLLKIWAHFFGHTDYTMRIMSAIFGAIAIVFAFLWLKYKYGVSVAVLGAFMMAISPTLVRYGQEMRMYTLAICIVFAATFFLQLAIDNGAKKWWVIYALLLAAGMWTHYFVAFAWLAHLAYLIKIYGRKIFQKKIIITYLVAIILFLPWLPSLLAQTKSVEEGFWIGDASASGLLGFATEALLYNEPNKITNWLLVLFVVDLVIIIALTIRYRKKLSMLLRLILVPIVVLLILSMPPLSSMFISRYILYSMVALSLLEATLIVLFFHDQLKCKNHLHSSARIACVVAVLIGSSICGICSVYKYGNYNFVTHTKSTSKEVFNELLALDGGENLSVIVADPWLYYDLAAYTSAEHNVTFVDETTEYIYGSLLPLKESYFGKINNLDTFLETREAVWYVGAEPESGKLDFPRDGWRATTMMSIKLDERSSRYQILKLERD